MAVPFVSSDKVRIGQEGNVALFEGWSSPDAKGCWSVDNVARLKFVIGKISPVPQRLRLVLWARPFLGRQLRRQEIDVAFNHADPIGVVMAGTGSIAVPIDAGSAKPGEVLEVSLHLPDVESPLDSGMGTDPRKLLGINIQSAQLESIAAPIDNNLSLPERPSFPLFHFGPSRLE